MMSADSNTELRNYLTSFLSTLCFPFDCSIPESSKVTTDDASSIASGATTPTSDLGMEEQGPRPICIVKTVDDHDFFLDEKNLASILMKVSHWKLRHVT